MGAENKVSNKIDDMGGKAKEAAGKLTGDDSTKNEGKLDQAKASLKRCWREGEGRLQELDHYDLSIGWPPKGPNPAAIRLFQGL